MPQFLEERERFGKRSLRAMLNAASERKIHAFIEVKMVKEWNTVLVKQIDEGIRRWDIESNAFERAFGANKATSAHLQSESDMGMAKGLSKHDVAEIDSPE